MISLTGCPCPMFSWRKAGLEEGGDEEEGSTPGEKASAIMKWGSKWGTRRGCQGMISSPSRLGLVLSHCYILI